MKQLLIIFFVFLSLQTFGDSRIFKHIQLSDGLSETSVTSIFQDQGGIVWIGTRDGLNLYDGRDMKIFRVNLEDKNSISGNSIKDIVQDEELNIWIGTNNGLSVYIKNKESFINYPLNKKKGLSGSSINSLFVDSNNVIWIGMNNGLYKFIKEEDRFQRIEKLSDYNVSCILQDKSGRYWIGTKNNGLLLFNERTKSFISFKNVKGNKQSISSNKITNILEDSKGRLWVSTKSGLNLMDRSTGTFKVYLHSSDNTSLINNNIRVTCEDKDGKLWIGTYKGISILDVEKDSFTNVVPDPYSPIALTHNSVYDMMKDQRGSIWIGTYFGGVNIYEESINSLKFYLPNILHPDQGVSYRVIGPIAEDQNGMIWIGTEGKGINIFNPTTKLFNHINYKTIGLPTPNENIKALHWTSEGDLWIGTNSSGIVIYNPKKKSFKHITKKEGLTSNTISDFKEKENQIYIATNDGVNVYNKNTSTFNAIKIEGKQDIRVRDLMIDHQNNLWFATETIGVFSYNPQTKEIEHYQHIANEENSLSTNFTTALYESLQGDIWIGTRGGGVNKFDSDSKQFVHYTINDGLDKNTINGIIESNTGNLWITTLSGLSKFDAPNNKFISYSVSDLLPNLEVNENAISKTKDGLFYVGTTQGMIIFDENNINFDGSKYAPKVNFTELQLNNKTVKVNDETGLLNEPISNTNHITLPYDFHFVTLRFSDFNFINNRSNVFAVKLDGFDTDWRNIGAVNEVTYNSLKAGDYILRIKSGVQGGKWYDNETIIKITVNTAPFATWWAYLLYAGLTILIIIVLWRYSLKMQKMEHGLDLAELERSKLEEVNQLKLKFFTNISHEFRTPLTLIMTPIKELIETKTGNKETKEKYEIIFKNANRLYQLINELMDFRKQETGNLHLRVKEHNLSKFLHDMFFSFKDHARMKNINYELDCPENIQLTYDSKQMEKVIINILSNAFKFTTVGGNIKLSCEEDQENHLLCIKIKDDGKGIPLDLQKTIFDRFYQIENNRENNEIGTGIGLALSKGIVELHGGEISVESEEGIGTTFSILLNTTDSHFTEEQFIDVEEEHDIDNQSVESLALIEDNQPTNDVTDGLKILVVEDNEDMRKLVASVFNKTCQVIEAVDGEEGLEMAVDEMPDLIISDIMMPKVSGIELCRKLKQNIKTSHIPVVLLTAKHSDDTKMMGIESGADGFVTKPFNSNMLKVRCRNLIKSRQMLRKKFATVEDDQVTDLGLNSLDEKLVQDAKKVIDEHLQDPEFNVNMLAREIGLGRTMLYTKIKAISGQTPNGFIQSYRLQKAADMLIQNPTLNVSEVCYAVGFNTPKYFSKCFTEQFGEKPSAYAKKKSQSQAVVVE